MLRSRTITILFCANLVFFLSVIFLGPEQVKLQSSNALFDSLMANPCRASFAVSVEWSLMEPIRLCRHPSIRTLGLRPVRRPLPADRSIQLYDHAVNIPCNFRSYRPFHHKPTPVSILYLNY